VKIDLIVRGLSCLRAGVKGLSENIRVLSIIGQLLEHSRIFHFQDGAEEPIDGKFYIGSADWMSRNQHMRVEVITPVEDRVHRERLWQILNISLKDKVQAWEMQADGHYELLHSKDNNRQGTQETLMRLTREDTETKH